MVVRMLVILITLVFMRAPKVRGADSQELEPPQSHWEYHLGQGLRVGNTGLTLGGYSSMHYDHFQNQPQKLSASAFSLFLSWNSGIHVRFFSELGWQDFMIAQERKALEKRQDKDEWGVFLQGTAPLIADFYAIGRYEYFSPQEPARSAHHWTAALAFHPLSPLVFKIEYNVGQRKVVDLYEGFSSSTSLLF